MERSEIRLLLDRLRAGEMSVDEVESRLRATPPFVDLEFATVDHHRALRQGHPEIIYGPGKRPEQVVAIAHEILERSGRLLVTRIDAEQAAALREALPEAEHDALARTFAVSPEERADGIAIVSAGTADQSASREALVTCRFLGQEPVVLNDVGVAGIHRLLRHSESLQAARVVIAVAGMEGALASVVGGLVPAPVIALPTSVGYGTGIGGIAALLSMLNSCASHVTCVNIDNGVGAAVVASLINRA